MPYNPKHGPPDHVCITCPPSVHKPRRPMCECGGYDHEHWGGGDHPCALPDCPCKKFTLSTGDPKATREFVKLDTDPEEDDAGPVPNGGAY